MAETYERGELDDVEYRWLKSRVSKGEPLPLYWKELFLISDESGIDLTSLLRDYGSTRYMLRIRYRRRDIASQVADMDEASTKRHLIELVAVARKMAKLSETLMKIAVQRSAKARRATATKGAEKRHASDPKQAAKAYAMSQWPEAHRRGLTALAFHGRLVNAGHSVQPDTVRKWVTNLRKSGTC